MDNKILKEIRYLKAALEKGYINLGEYEKLSNALSKGISEAQYVFQGLTSSTLQTSRTAVESVVP